MKKLALILVLLLSQNTFATENNPAQSLEVLTKAANKAQRYYSLLPTENEPEPVTRCVIIGARTAQIYLLAELRTELGLEQQFIAMKKTELAEKAAQMNRTVNELMKWTSELSDECYDKGSVSADTVAAYNRNAQPLHKLILKQIRDMQAEVR